MKKRVTIREPDRLERFMNSFQENHSEDFKALALHLVATSDIQTVAAQTGLPLSTLYDWQDDWNKKKNQDYKTGGGRRRTKTAPDQITTRASKTDTD